MTPAGARGPVAVGICSSTGGPRALERLLAALPAAFPLPILVAQHISAGFLDGLVTVLDRRTALPVAIAREGAPAAAGVWLAPDDAHLTVDRSLRLRLDRRTVNGHHRPSGDLLLESLATATGGLAVGVVLTGMGRDGSRGVAALRAAGGLVLAQDESSAAAYGMPRAATQAGARALPLDQIATALRRLERVRA